MRYLFIIAGVFCVISYVIHFQVHADLEKVVLDE